MKSHFIATWRKPHSRQPIYSRVHPTELDAVEDLRSVFDFSVPDEETLVEYGVLPVSIRRKNDNILKLVECCCPDPESHNIVNAEHYQYVLLPIKIAMGIFCRRDDVVCPRFTYYDNWPMCKVHIPGLEQIEEGVLRPTACLELKVVRGDNDKQG